jgi:hypothetical protein
MRSMLLGLLCVAMWWPVSAAAPDVTAKVIDQEIYYQQPPGPCEIPAAVIQIARVVQVPAGIEPVPEICRNVAPSTTSALPPPPRERVYLTGKSVREALDELVAVDARYYWVQSDGVIVIRPVVAWGDARHFLHRTLRRFSLVEENLGGALDEWRRAMWGADAPPPSEHMRGGQRTELGDRRFNVVVDGAATAFDALNLIVRTHGALYWEIGYCQPAADARFATVWLWTSERDRTGLGVPLKERFSSVDNKRVDVCRGRM